MQRHARISVAGFLFVLFLVLPALGKAQSSEPHGDHNPHHGGFVLMYQDLHFEVVLIPEGGVGVWFTDAQRNELPATAVSDVVVEIEHAEGKTEYPSMRISDAGDYWLGESGSVGNPESVVRVGFLYEGEPWMLDLPASYLMPDSAQNANGAMAEPDPHAGH